MMLRFFPIIPLILKSIAEYAFKCFFFVSFAESLIFHWFVTTQVYHIDHNTPRNQSHARENDIFFGWSVLFPTHIISIICKAIKWVNIIFESLNTSSIPVPLTTYAPPLLE